MARRSSTSSQCSTTPTGNAPSKIRAMRNATLPGLHGRFGLERLASTTQPGGDSNVRKSAHVTGDPDELSRGFESARDDLHQIDGFFAGPSAWTAGAGRG